MTLTKTIIRTFIAAAATLPLLLVSCQHRNTNTIASLQTAEELLETNPREALALLAEIEDGKLKIEDYPAEEAGQKSGKNLPSSIFNFQSKKEAALYAILRTQADYKCFVPLTSDSLIRIATDYYGRPRRPHYHAAMAWYSLGCVRAEQGDDIGAVEAFLTAQPLFPDTTSRYYALCCQNLGHHYANRGMFDDALAAYRRFGRSPAVSERDTLVNNYHIARVLINRGTADEADTLLQRLIRHPRAAEGLKQKAHFEAAKLCCYLREDYPTAKAHAYDCLRGKTFGAVYSVLGDAYLGLGQADSAAYCFRRALHEDEELFTQANICRKMAPLSLQLGHPDSVAYYMEHYTLLADSAWRQWNGTELAELNSRHEMEMQSRREKARREHLTTLLASSFIFVLLIVATLFLLIERYQKNRLIRLQQLLSKARLEILRQKEKMESMQSIPPEENQQLLDLRRGQCTLSRQAFFLTPWAKRLNEFEVKGQDLTLEQNKELRATLADCFADVMVDLKNDCPSLNLDEVYYCLYSYLGMSTNLIAHCERSNPTVLRKRKSRIRSKVGDDWSTLFFNA